MQRSTINQLKQKLSDIASAHGQIKDFQFIELQDIDTNSRMPLMWAFIADTGATQNGVVLSVPVSISVMDLVNKSENNKIEVSSDCLEIIKDIVSVLRQEDDLFIMDDTNLVYKDFYEANDFEVTGWNVVVNLKILNDFNSCDIPENEEIMAYKVYTALLTQTTTNDPAVTVLQNTIGDIAWTRSDIGLYTGVLSNAFTAGKTTVNYNVTPHDNFGGFMNASRTDADTITINTSNNLGDNWPAQDGWLNQSFIEIRVYN